MRISEMIESGIMDNSDFKVVVKDLKNAIKALGNADHSLTLANNTLSNTIGGEPTTKQRHMLDNLRSILALARDGHRAAANLYKQIKK